MCPADTPFATPIDVTRLTRKQAEKVTGVSRATLLRAVADGKLSAMPDKNGYKVYDASELQRVFADKFDLRRLETPAARDGVSHDGIDDDTPRDGVLLASLTIEKKYLIEDRDRLREEAERLRRELAEERGKREGERTEYLKLLQQSQDTVKLLTDQSTKEPPAPPRPRGFLDWLLNRKSQ